MKQIIIATYRTKTGQYGRIQRQADADLGTVSGMSRWLLENLPPSTSLSSWSIQQSPWTPAEIVLMRIPSQEKAIGTLTVKGSHTHTSIA